MLSKQGFTTGIHYELMSSDKESDFTVFVPKVILKDDYECFMEAHQIRLKKIHDCYGLALEDRKMSFEINNVDLANEGLNEAYAVLDELLKDDHFDRVFESILELLRFIFSLMLCLTYNQECLSLSNNLVNQEHAKGVKNLNIFDSQAKTLVEKLSSSKWKDTDRIEWLQLVWFVNNVLKVFKNPKVFPGFLKQLIEMQFNKLAGNWDRPKDSSKNIVQLKKYPKLGRVEFLEPFTEETLNSISNSYLVSVNKDLGKKHG